MQVYDGNDRVHNNENGLMHLHGTQNNNLLPPHLPLSHLPPPHLPPSHGPPPSPPPPYASQPPFIPDEYSYPPNVYSNNKNQPLSTYRTSSSSSSLQPSNVDPSSTYPPFVDMNQVSHVPQVDGSYSEDQKRSMTKTKSVRWNQQLPTMTHRNSGSVPKQQTKKTPRSLYSADAAPLPPPKDSFVHEIFSNLPNVLKYAAIGAGMGGLYGCFQNLTSKRMIHYQLNPNPEYFYIDPIMSQYFHRMADYREYHEDAYCQALKTTDELFKHEATIRRRKARYGDKSLAKMWIKGVILALTHLQQWINDPNHLVKFRKLKQAIWNRLLAHLRNIIRRVNATIYPRLSFVKLKEKRNPMHYVCRQYLQDTNDSSQTICMRCGQEQVFHRKKTEEKMSSAQQAHQAQSETDEMAQHMARMSILDPTTTTTTRPNESKPDQRLPSSSSPSAQHHDQPHDESDDQYIRPD